MVEARSLDPAGRWSALDPAAEPLVDWAREPGSDRVTLLLGAFDPPTNAHVEILRAGMRASGSAGAWGLTKVLLARDAAELFTVPERIGLLDAVAEREGFGLALANRGTYLEVHRALVSQGVEATFVVGADKLEQLADPSFYPDGERGVASTFEEVSFLVVPRDGRPVPSGVGVLDGSSVFTDPSTAALSATYVRGLVFDGRPVDHLVPPEVQVAIRGYTSAR